MLGREDIGIDLGTASVLVYIKGRGVVLREPAMVAMNRETRNILTVGDEARRMHGRTPGDVATIRPLKDGTINDFNVTERMLRYFIRRIIGRRALFRPRVVISVPGSVPDVEKRSVLDAVLDAGARRAQMLDVSIAGALGAGLQVSDNYGRMLIDVGGGVTDISIITQERTVVRRTTKIAGDLLDETLIRFLRRKHNLMVGDRTAEELKTNIGAALKRTEEKLYLDVIGRNLVTGLPKMLRVHSDEVSEALDEPVQALSEEIHTVLEQAPPELAADIFDNGITMIGGGAQLFGLAETLAANLKVPCRLAEDPQSCVATGIGRVMESEDELGQTLLDFRQIRRRAPA